MAAVVCSVFVCSLCRCCRFAKFKSWVKELVVLDGIAEYNLLCSGSLVFASERLYLHSGYDVGATGACCFVYSIRAC
ncbi:hypothetical protein TETLIM2_000103 [Candidatus Hodgkinia cicadicola]|nr:hypothetical protein TETLIM2_000103 [Candidatus Hodgkinia cicadicola]